MSIRTRLAAAGRTLGLPDEPDRVRCECCAGTGQVPVVDSDEAAERLAHLMAAVSADLAGDGEAASRERALADAVQLPLRRCGLCAGVGVTSAAALGAWERSVADAGAWATPRLMAVADGLTVAP